jgi:hypothetical protein
VAHETSWLGIGMRLKQVIQTESSGRPLLRSREGGQEVRRMYSAPPSQNHGCLATDCVEGCHRIDSGSFSSSESRPLYSVARV